jgi:hypothetical protein
MSSRTLVTVTIAKFLLDLIFYVGGAGGVALALWVAVSPLVVGPNHVGDTAIPVAVGEGLPRPVVVLEVDRDAAPEIHRAVLVDARGELRVRTTDWSLQFLPNLGMLIAIGIALYIVFALRRMLTTVIVGDPFAEANVRRMWTMGLLLLVVGVVGPVLEYLVARALLVRVPVSGVALSAPLDAQTNVILIGLLLLVLSAVFARGAELERERSLTV